MLIVEHQVIMSSANVSGTDRKPSLLSDVTWSPDDKMIVACFGTQNPKVIEPKTKQVIRELVIQGDQPRADVAAHFDESLGYIASWSPDCKSIAVGRNRVVQIFDAATGQGTSTHSIRINPATAQESMSLLSSDPVLSRLPPIGNRDEQIQRIDKYLQTIGLGLSTLRWDATGIAIGTEVGAYRLDLVNGSKRMSLRPNPCPGVVRSPVVSPNGKYLAGLFVPDVDVLGDLYWNFNRALNMARRVLQIWNMETGAAEVHYQGDDLPDWQQCRLYWSADSKNLAWGHDNKVVVYELFRQTSRVLLRSQDDHINYLAWHPVYNHVAVDDSSDGIVVYDTASSVRRANYRDAMWGRYKDVGGRVFAWSNAGDSLVVGGVDSNIDVWRVY